MYLHLTNLNSPVDQVDMNFLNVLGDYRIGPPQPTQKREVSELVADGVFGVYTTAEALDNPQVRKLTGFSIGALSNARL